MRRFNTMIIEVRQCRVKRTYKRSVYSLRSRLAKALAVALARRGIRANDPIVAYARRCSA